MSATNKTPNLDLPQWVQGDEIEREDFNAAFEAIDETVVKLMSHDTRTNDLNPTQHYSKYGRGLTVEFKATSTMGVPSGRTYGILMTVMGWSPALAQQAIQLFFAGDANLFFRGVASETAWQTWRKVDSTST